MQMDFSIEYGLAQVLVMLIMGSSTGLPPAERDNKLVNCAPANTSVYIETSALGVPEKHSKGWDGFIQEDEVKLFFRDLDKTFETVITQIEEGDDEYYSVQASTVLTLLNTLPKCSKMFFLSFHDQKKIEDKKQVNKNEKDYSKYISAAVVVNAGKDADVLEKNLLNFLNAYNNNFQPESWSEIEFEKMNKLEIPILDCEETVVILDRKGNYLSISLGKNSHQLVDQGLAGKSQGFAQSDTYEKYAKPMLYQRNTSLAYLDFKLALKGVSTIFPEEALMLNTGMSQLGLNGLEKISMSSGLVEGQVQSKSILWNKGDLRGVLSIFTGPGFKPEDLHHVPGDADMVAGYSFDINRMFKTFEDVAFLDLDTRNIFNELIKNLEDFFKISIKEEFLPALGNHVVIHNAPSQGGVLFSAPVLKISLKKPDVIKKLIDQITSVIINDVDSVYTIQYYTREFQDQTIHNIGYNKEEMPIHFSWTFTSDAAYFSLHPAAIKSQLTRLKKQEKSQLKIEAQKHFGNDSKVVMFLHLDTQKSGSAGYSLLEYCLTYINNRFYEELEETDTFNQNVSLSIFSLPSYSAFSPYQTTTWNLIKIRNEEIIQEGQTSVDVSLLNTCFWYFKFLTEEDI